MQYPLKARQKLKTIFQMAAVAAQHQAPCEIRLVTQYIFTLAAAYKRLTPLLHDLRAFFLLALNIVPSLAVSVLKNTLLPSFPASRFQLNVRICTE